MNTDDRIAQAYRIAHLERLARLARGERLCGRKIGFTNPSIWPIYNVHGPIWGSMWNTTVHELSGQCAQIDLSRFAEPRIEPEIVFGFKCTPASAALADVMNAIAWVAHGYEIVQSVYPAWKFTAADAIAAGSLHGCLIIGEKRLWTSLTPQAWQLELQHLKLDLFCNDRLIESGVGSNVLGGPLQALCHLVSTLSTQTPDQGNTPIAAGDIVTTGTLTDARPLNTGQRWQTQLQGSGLTGLELRT